MHGVRIDRINRLVEQRVVGALDLAEVERSGAAVRAAVRSLGTAPGAHVTLYDLSETAPLDDAVIESALRQFADPRFTCVCARKVALLAPSALARMKLNAPAGSRDNMRMFADRGDAMRWLLS